MSDEIVEREELEAAIEARKELGADMEPAVIDAFVERIEQRLAQRGGQGDRALGAMGISIPMIVVAAIFTGLAGVLAVCGALAVIAIVSAR